MVGTEREVAFRKRKRDYAISRPKNYIRAQTTIIHQKGEKFVRPESILARSRAIKTDKRRFDINSKRGASINFPQPAEDDKIALVVRTITKKEYTCQDSYAILKELRLVNQFDGCIVVLTPEMRQKLKCISHLITYGVPTSDMIDMLIHNHAHTIVDEKEVEITSNQMVQQAGIPDCECVGDIIYSLQHATDNCAAIAQYLAPFHFTQREIKHEKALITKEGGNAGWRGDKINEFVQSII